MRRVFLMKILFLFGILFKLDKTRKNHARFFQKNIKKNQTSKQTTTNKTIYYILKKLFKSIKKYRRILFVAYTNDQGFFKI